jgi:hypothetical protein
MSRRFLPLGDEKALYGSSFSLREWARASVRFFTPSLR